MSRWLPSPMAGLSSALIGWRGLLLLLGLALAWHALQGMSWFQAWELLSGIGPLTLLILLALNLSLLPLMTGRWWQLLRMLDAPVGLPVLCAYRCAANAVSYLTPGPHFGGEPLSIFLLYKLQRVPLAAASASVALDRLLEFVASIVVLCLSLLFLTAIGRPFSNGWTLFLGLAILAALAALLTVLSTGRKPLARFITWCRRFVPARCSTVPILAVLIQGEAEVETLLCSHRRLFVPTHLFALAYWLGVFAEFWLMSAAIGQILPFWQLAAVVLTARLAFFTPLPAGLGVLESALPWVTASLGLGSAFGFGLCLLIRLRDLLFVGVGLLLTMKYVIRPAKALTINKNLG